MSAPRRELHELARLHGLQTAYYDVRGRRHSASPESLLAMLRALGAPVKDMGEVARALRERNNELRQRLIEPVVVAWNGDLATRLSLPAPADRVMLDGHLKLEDGAERHWQIATDTLVLPGLPPGYHRMSLEAKGRVHESLIISAPPRTYSPAERNLWGVFLPLYALHTGRSWGAGDYRDMAALIDWAKRAGGAFVGTLPLLPTFPGDPSPYRPVSRRFWNEFYVSLDNLPELENCPAARAIMAEPSFQEEISFLRASPLVDYPRQWDIKRRVLAELARGLLDRDSPRREELRRFAVANPIAADYARFRAVVDCQSTPWTHWPASLRNGRVGPGDYDEGDRLCYLYAQWLAHQQVEELSGAAGSRARRLYLDLPLGVHPDGFDVWRESDLFLQDVSAGAPPDAVFTRGQDWAFPPLHPEKCRQQGHDYVISYLRHHLRCAAILRIDHVMGLHHLYCLPSGAPAGEGVYLRYPAEELYAIVCLESHRYRTAVAGEDLGTVPGYVRPMMARHGFHRTYVLDYELASERTPNIPASSVASLGTHDMFPFAAFWQDEDIPVRQKLGILGEEAAAGEREARRRTRSRLIAYLYDRGWLRPGETADESAILRGCLSLLAASPASMVLSNLEDLWGETRPQNIPSTTGEYPNWRRRARYSLEEFCQMSAVTDTLSSINNLRRWGNDDTD